MPLCGQEWLFLQCSGSNQDPGLCQGDSDSVWVLGYCSNVSRVSLSHFIPGHALKSCCYGQNWLRDQVLSSILHPGLGCPRRLPGNSTDHPPSALRGRPAPRQEKDETQKPGRCRLLASRCWGSFVGEFVLSSRVKSRSAIAPLWASSCEGTG